MAAAAVGAYIGAAYWFTSSTSFANPAVTIGRMFSDTFAGIAPASAAGFILAQIVGALVGLALIAALYPDAAQAADASTRQIGATPKRSLWLAMNSQTEPVSGGCAGRSPARRNLLPPSGFRSSAPAQRCGA